MFMVFNRLKKKPQFQKIQKLQNLFHILMSRASAVLKVLLSETWMIIQCAAKGWNSLGNWHMNLWAAELGKYYSNVYGKISFAPLNILSIDHGIFSGCVPLLT